jgi:hypothetical protein
MIKNFFLGGSVSLVICSKSFDMMIQFELLCLLLELPVANFVTQLLLQLTKALLAFSVCLSVSVKN